MKVLWIINTPTPRAASALGIAMSGFPTWIEASHQAMLERDDTDISIAFPTPGEPRSATSDGSTYVTFPPVEFGAEQTDLPVIEDLVRQGSPDLVHIFGTEGGHAYVAAQACRRLGIPFVVGLQGLSAAIAQHYLSGLPARISHGFTLRDALRLDNTVMQAAKYRSRGVREARTLALAKHVIGRTSWDRAISGQINQESSYHTVPETLRSAFYVNRWSRNTCEPYSIFVSQGHYPIKGLHFVLQALPRIIERHPETRLFVAGVPPRSSGMSGRLRQTKYAAYLTKLVRQAHLRDHVHFVGVLDESMMIEQYLRSHVFLSSSTVENESNSLSEAKLLGIPVVASYVGGVVDRIKHGETGFFYQHDAPYMLAHYVDRLFRDTALCERLGAAARAESLELNDGGRNAQLLRDAYLKILRESPRHACHD